MTPVENLVLMACEGIAAQVDGSAVVIAWPDHGDPMPKVAVIANATSAAAMIRRLCETVTSVPRPTDCEGCGRAWDRVQLAGLALEPLDNETACN